MSCTWSMLTYFLFFHRVCACGWVVEMSSTIRESNLTRDTLTFDFAAKCDQLYAATSVLLRLLLPVQTLTGFRHLQGIDLK